MHIRTQLCSFTTVYIQYKASCYKWTCYLPCRFETRVTSGCICSVLVRPPYRLRLEHSGSGRGFWVIMDDVCEHDTMLLIVLVPFSTGCSSFPCLECTWRNRSHLSAVQFHIKAIYALHAGGLIFVVINLLFYEFQCFWLICCKTSHVQYRHIFVMLLSIPWI